MYFLSIRYGFFDDDATAALYFINALTGGYMKPGESFQSMRPDEGISNWTIDGGMGRSVLVPKFNRKLC